ncbi:precorrin-3B synthase [Rhodococcus tibetensis]|uniref:Precorrin-3B synthase n=1 Tax=Rhodococcus tibetensis TaxID=2965064 RepID=A0ABT1QEF6_9NOCA|nr:precorrin-3B synthase [Rhodococcus sp. FXJ9.536]MCQ4120043.1 precorrin-3B synthase [Rhodococcus sp. FXJ9.536]
MVAPRSRPDACPGALQVHQAADGPLARVRLPGGVLTPAQLQVLAESARDLGNGEIELTSRGNVQLRAVDDPAEFARRLADTGLLPSHTHERVRNILASPLTGRIGGVADLRDLVDELDRRLCADSALAELPGRVLFTLDDGRGDVSALGGDFGVHAVNETEVALVLAGCDSGARISVAQSVDVLLDAARTFLGLRGGQWRLSEIDDGIERTLTALTLQPTAEPVTGYAEHRPPIGWLDQPDGTVTLGGGLAFGILESRMAEFLAAVEKPVIVTPWRSVLLCDLDEWSAEQVVRVLAPMGLIFDENSPWLLVSACTGRPGCEKALADVRTDARDAVLGGELPAPGRQHWSGCDRCCGRPKGEVTDVVATGTGYRVDNP